MKQSYTVLFPTSSLSSYLPLYQAMKGQKKISYRVVAGDFSAYSVGHFFSDRFYLLPLVSKPNYLQKLKTLCQRTKADILWPLSAKEAVIINQEPDFFKKNQTKVITCSNKTIKICSDKLKLGLWFMKNQISTPKLIRQPQEIKRTGQYVIKPRHSSASQGVQILKGARVKGLGKDYIVQEFINGQEYTVDCLIGKAGQLIALVIRERVTMAGGQSRVARTVKDKQIVLIVSKIVNLMPFYGLINIQFIKRKSQLFVLEINPRPAMGGLALSLKAGVNFPLLLIKDLLALPIKKSETTYQEGLGMFRYITQHYYEDK